jgi:D-alanyl-D-alanine dipeptidase
MRWRSALFIFATIAAGLAAGLGDMATAHRPARDFVYLRDVAPSVEQDIRYAGANNVTARALKGYEAPECVLRKRTAKALKRVQAALEGQGFGLKVYDCYRPQSAVLDLVAYTEQPGGARNSVYHPNVPRSDLIKEGYIAEKSGHSTGLAVDLTLVALVQAKQLRSKEQCGGRTGANELDMGTGFDCFDALAWPDRNVPEHVRQNRQILADAMRHAGFAPYAREWWHFSLAPKAGAETRPMNFAVVRE